jgi:hypothetical protein
MSKILRSPLPRQAAINNHASSKYFYTYPIYACDDVLAAGQGAGCLMGDSGWRIVHRLLQPVFMREKKRPPQLSPLSGRARNISIHKFFSVLSLPNGQNSHPAERTRTSLTNATHHSDRQMPPLASGRNLSGTFDPQAVLTDDAYKARFAKRKKERNRNSRIFSVICRGWMGCGTFLVNAPKRAVSG